MCQYVSLDTYLRQTQGLYIDDVKSDKYENAREGETRTSVSCDSILRRYAPAQNSICPPFTLLSDASIVRACMFPHVRSSLSCVNFFDISLFVPGLAKLASVLTSCISVSDDSWWGASGGGRSRQQEADSGRTVGSERVDSSRPIGRASEVQMRVVEDRFSESLRIEGQADKDISLSLPQCSDEREERKTTYSVFSLFQRWSDRGAL